jgi:hypothetical protein
MRMVRSFGTWLQEVRRRVRLARNQHAQARRQLDEQRFADREARHAAGIYERPDPGPGPGGGF